MTYYRCQFVGLVAYAAVVGDCHPAAPAYFLQPYFVRAIVRKVVGVALYTQACRSQGFRKALAQVPVGKEYAAHAARS